MEVDKQLKFKSHKRMQVEFISNSVDVITHDCLSSVALAKDRSKVTLRVAQRFCATEKFYSEEAQTSAYEPVKPLE